MIIYRDLFNKIVQPETLFQAWKEFRVGKGRKPDVLLFERELEHNIFQLSRELKTKTYVHSGYTGFYISDPKLRHIHKATVRDRVLHHAIMSTINHVFDPTFIPESFSCRVGKGSHKGVEVVQGMLRKESKNNTKTCYALKCDVRKFFDSIDHDILLSILRRRIKDADLLWLLDNLVESYSGTQSDLFKKKGVPIGNLTSQLFANVYMNEFDQYMKHILKVRYYARYTDDFIIVSRDKEYLEKLIKPMNVFLRDRLGVNLHPNKVEILTYAKGVDFLGYVVFPNHTLLRKRTKKRVIRKFEAKIKDYTKGKVEKEKIVATLHSYLGVLSHANAYKLSMRLRNYFGLWIN